MYIIQKRGSDPYHFGAEPLFRSSIMNSNATFVLFIMTMCGSCGLGRLEPAGT